MGSIDIAPITILVVEDDPDLSMLTRDLLEEEGYGVEIATSGRAGLQWLADNVPSLIVLDLVITDMTGWEFDAQRRRDPRLRDVPVIVTSGLTPWSDAAKSIEAVARLVKPYQIASLLALIQEHARPAAIFDPTATTIDLVY